MKKHRLTIFITLILLVIAIILIISSSNTTLRRALSDFAIEDTSNVVKIFLADKQNRNLTLEKKQISEWKINGIHKASKRKVETLLKTMKDVKVFSPVPKAAHNNVVSRMAANSVKVEIYQVVPRINIFNWLKLFPHEKLTRTYYVGGATKDNLGTYMLMEHSTTPYITYLPMFRGFLTTRYTTLEDDWRDHTVFDHHLDKIHSVSLEFFKEPENSYRAVNIDNLNLGLIDLYKQDSIKDFDTLKLLSFLTAFENIKFEAILSNKRTPEFIDSVINSQPVHRITLVDNMGDTTRVTTYFKKGFAELYQEDGYAMEQFDLVRMFALVNDDRDFVLIQYFVFDKVLRPLSYFKKGE